MHKLGFILSLILILTGAALHAADGTEALAEALQKALERSNFAEKKRLAELRDVADVDWPGFRLLDAEGRLELPAPAASSPEGHEHPEGIFACGVCGGHLFAEDRRLASGTELFTFSAPREASLVATDLHSEWSAKNGKIELRCGLCGNHLGHVDPGSEASAPLRFVVEAGQLKTKK